MRILNSVKIPSRCSSGIILEELRSRTRDVTANGYQVLFLTVSPNPSTRHEVSRMMKGKLRKLKMPYKLMDHNEQHDYLEMYMKKVYIDSLDPTDWIYYIYETNKDNNLHVHALMYLDNVQTEYELNALRKYIFSNVLTIVNLSKKNKNVKDYMNNIFYVNNDDPTSDVFQKIEYLTKQADIKLQFPDTTFGFQTDVKVRRRTEEISECSSEISFVTSPPCALSDPVFNIKWEQ